MQGARAVLLGPVAGDDGHQYSGNRGRRTKDALFYSALRCEIADGVRRQVAGDGPGSGPQVATLGDDLIGPDQCPPARQEPDDRTETEDSADVRQKGHAGHRPGETHGNAELPKTHVGSLMLELETRNRVEIAMWAYEPGRM